MYVGSYDICVLNWNWWLTQDHFLIKHWSQRTRRCSARVVGLEDYSLVLVSRYNTVRSGTLTWREWGLWTECSLTIGTGWWVKFLAWFSIAQSVCQRALRLAWFESCIQQMKTTCLLSIQISFACAKASTLTTTLQQNKAKQNHMHILWDVLRLLKWLHKVTTILITDLEPVLCQSYH